MVPSDAKQTASGKNGRETLSPLYKRKIRSTFKAWVLTPPALFALCLMIDPVVDFKTGCWIAFWIGVFSLGITSNFFAGFYGTKLKREQKSTSLSLDN